jgi:hypothetical protein
MNVPIIILIARLVGQVRHWNEALMELDDEAIVQSCVTPHRRQISFLNNVAQHP